MYFCGLGDNPFDVPSMIGDRVSNAKNSFGFEISLGHTCYSDVSELSSVATTSSEASERLL